MNALPGWLDRRRYAHLLAALLLLIVGFPFVARLDFGPYLLRGLWVLVVVVAVLSAGGRAGLRHVALFLGVLALVPRILEPLLERHFPAATEGLSGLLLVFVAWVILKDVLQRDRVTAETINGALCVYLLAGLIWSQLYLIVESAAPGSFRLAEAASHPGDLEQQLTYFSFVTQTTLGYGDMAPVSPVARSLSIGQAVTGQLYLAVLIARLVALEIAHRREPAG
jgi:hypothetical protein